MTAFIIRVILALVATSFNVYLFFSGYWGWGIFFIFITALIILSFFRNENMILALNQMRVGNQDKAKAYINKIAHPHLLPKKQHAYVLYLRAVLGAQELGFSASEQLLRKALSLGLRTSEDNAVARMHLAGISAQTGRRPEALTLLAEAKKTRQKWHAQGSNQNAPTAIANGAFQKSNAYGADDRRTQENPKNALICLLHPAPSRPPGQITNYSMREVAKN